ncbi:amidohydrolase [Elioraea rosea]|uniref:amidohydrolase n=1 Tax=Elioraea rosea TaxID=2492390 RepID=UPI00131599DF|nr:amidohydrolase [Elioraea rosea]
MLEGGLVLDPSRTHPVRADVLIEGDTISAIAAPLSVSDTSIRRVDARRRLVVPGLVNTHTHSHFTLAKGLNPGWTLERHQNAAPWVTGGATAEDLHLSATLAAAEMILRGCTSCYDMVVHPPVPTEDGLAAIAAGYDAVGMRAVIAMSIADMTFWEAIPGLIAAMPDSARQRLEALRAAPGDATLAGCRQVLSTWRSRRVRAAIAPTIPLLCSDAFLTAAARLAREFDVGLHTHVAESEVQARVARQRYGTSLVGHLDRLGYLGPDLLAAHAVWLDADDITLLAEKGVSVAHNPASNLRLGNGIASIAAMRAAGIRIGLGTDACTCSDQLNMFEAMRMAALVSRAGARNAGDWLSPHDVFAMATTIGGEILGVPRLGRIEARAPADLVLLDLDQIAYVPLNDALTQLVFNESGAGVDSVMVAGEWVLENRRFTRLDYDRLVARVHDANAAARQRTAHDRPFYEMIDPIVGLFCSGLSMKSSLLDRHLDIGSF